STAVPQQASLFAIPVALLFRLALVVSLLASRQRQFQLRAATIIEVELQRHHGHPLPGHGIEEAGHFTLADEQLAQAPRLMIEAIALRIFRNIGIDEPELAIFKARIAFRYVGLIGAQRLDLGACQNETGFERIEDFKIEARL